MADIAKEGQIEVPWRGWVPVRRLGRGGFGSVWEISRAIAGYTERAAMKIVPVPADDSVIESLLDSGYDEAQARAVVEDYRDSVLSEYNFMRSVSGHANVVECHDVAWMPAADGLSGRVYIRMELLTSLRDKIRKKGDLSEAEVLKVGEDVCRALELCERRGIVHRDVKPDNVMVSDDGVYKLGDFGIARTMEHATHATRVGTASFVAPEVIYGSQYDHTVDIYSLGLVLHWLLNGRRIPFMPAGQPPTRKALERASARRLTGELLPPPERGSEAVHAVIARACAYKPQDRYQHASQMRAALKAAEENGTGTTARGVSSTTTTTTPSPSRPGPQVRKVVPASAESHAQKRLAANQLAGERPKPASARPMPQPTPRKAKPQPRQAAPTTPARPTVRPQRPTPRQEPTPRQRGGGKKKG